MSPGDEFQPAEIFADPANFAFKKGEMFFVGYVKVNLPKMPFVKARAT